MGNINRSGYKKTKIGWIPEEWELKKIESAGEVLSGRQRSPHAKGTLRQYLRVANVFDDFIDISDVKMMPFTDSEYERFRLQTNDILLNEGQSLGLVGRSAIYQRVPSNCCFQNTLIRFRASKETNVEYAQQLFTFLCAQGIFASIASQTTSIAHLGALRFARLKAPFPPLPEQEKIAEILSAWDRAIKQTRKLINAKQRLKNGLMQQLLTGRMRFPGFGKPAENGALPDGWKEVRLQNLFSPVKRKNEKDCQRVLTASGAHGLVDQRDFFNRSVASTNLKTYYLLCNGEFAYNRSSMKGYPFGAIKRLTNYAEGALSTLYVCFAISGKSALPEFYEHYFESGYLNKSLRGIVQVGARAHGLLNITTDDFFHLKIPHPPLDEQEKIAAVLNACNREIEQLEKKEAALRLQKKGMMQKLLTGEVRVNFN